MGKKIAFFVGGTGLGNATRSIPVIESAVQQGWNVSVATSSLSFDLIQQRFDGQIALTRLRRQRLAGQKRLRMLELMLRLPLFLTIFFRNLITAGALLRRSGAKLVFVDSEYSGLLAAKLLRCHVVVINQGALVKHQWKVSARQHRRRLRFSFYGLEFIEDLLYRRLADRILVPSPGGDHQLPAPYQVISPPTRFKRETLNTDPIDVLFIAGGSGMGDISHLENLARVQPSVKITVIGKVDQTLMAPNVQFHGVVSDSQRYIESAHYVVAQGGHSSLMDLIFLGKPALLLPIEGHAEQHMNALWAEQQGFCIVCRRGDNLELKFNDYRCKFDGLRERIQNFSFGDQGGSEALLVAELVELN